MGEGLATGAEIGGDFVVVRDVPPSSPRSELTHGREAPTGGLAGRWFEVEQRSTGLRRTLRWFDGRTADGAAAMAREARVAARIRSEHVTELVAAGADGAMLWIVTELLDGESLAARIARGPLSAAEARELLLQLCHGVGAAHAEEVVHGALRPERVMVCSSRRADVGSTVKILDFGTGRMLEGGAEATSEPPLYRAPEQLEYGTTLTPSADVHSIGLLAFAMLTGKPYWKGASGEDVLAAEILAEVVSSARPAATARAELFGVGHLVPTGFDGWFQRATARAASARFPTAAAAFKELDPILVAATTTAVAHAPTQALHLPSAAGVGATLVGAPLDLPASLAQFAVPRPVDATFVPTVQSPHQGPIDAQPAHPAASTALGPSYPGPSYSGPGAPYPGPSNPGPSYPGSGAPYPGPSYPGPPAGTGHPVLGPPMPPPYGVGAPPGPRPKPGLKRAHWMGMAAAGVAVVGVGIVAVVLATRTPGRPKRVWDDDDDRPTRRTSGKDVDEGAAPELERARAYTPVKVDLHVMSQCPFAIQVENTLDTVRKNLGDAVELNVEFIGTNRGGELQSMHGPKEVTGDLFQVCAEKHTRDWYDVVLCQNRDAKKIDANWDACAQTVGVPPADIAAVDACAIGQEGKDLLSASFDASNTAKATGSPTIFVNGELFQGGRTVSAFSQKICAAYGPGQARPPACDSLKPAPAVDVKILTDARCEDCKPERLKTQVLAKFSGAKITVVDYLDPAGQSLWSIVQPNKLPAIVYDAVQADLDPDGASLLKGAKKIGTSYVSSVGAAWNPQCADPGGCSLADCASSLICRPETPGTLDLYLMSRCPFAAKGLVALKEVMKNFTDHGSTVNVAVHYIAEALPGGTFKSLHGQDEVDDDLRGVCAAKYYPRAYLDFLYCRAGAVKDPWQGCTGPVTGLDQGTLSACMSGNDGEALLKKSIGETEAMSIRASPTWIVNGKYKFSGIDAETIKDAICAHNTLGGCSVHLSGPPSRSRP